MFEKLLEPIEIGNVKIKNRIAMSPMNMTFSTQDGYATPQNIAWHARRARGGFGLIFTDAIIVTKLAAPFCWQRNLLLYDNTYIAGLNRIVEAVHSFKSKIFAQLSIGFGRQGHARDNSQPYAPSPIPFEIPLDMVNKKIRVIASNPIIAEISRKGEIPREMTIEEIQSEQIEFAKACERSINAGFDGIEIHAPHGYLEHQFFSPRSNKRTDMYGGSLENRMRFILETTKKALDAVRGAVPVGIRMSCAEHMPEGFTIKDVKVVAKKLEELGISYFNLSDGSYEATKYFFPDDIEHVENHLLKEAKELRDTLTIPIITPSIHDPILADRAIAEGITDMTSLGRQAIADPDWPNKVKENRAEKIVTCRRCQQCIVRCISNLFPRCAVNKEVGFEEYDLTLFPKGRKGSITPKGYVAWYSTFNE
ncbi:MAG: hypothetical protein ACFE96_18910 [Candidatus Hermodarchaeota archaeon]